MEVLRGVVDDASDLQDFAAGAGIGAHERAAGAILLVEENRSPGVRERRRVRHGLRNRARQFLRTILRRGHIDGAQVRPGRSAGGLGRRALDGAALGCGAPGCRHLVPNFPGRDGLGRHGWTLHVLPHRRHEGEREHGRCDCCNPDPAGAAAKRLDCFNLGVDHIDIASLDGMRTVRHERFDRPLRRYRCRFLRTAHRDGLFEQRPCDVDHDGLVEAGGAGVAHHLRSTVQAFRPVTQIPPFELAQQVCGDTRTRRDFLQRQARCAPRASDVRNRQCLARWKIDRNGCGMRRGRRVFSLDLSRGRREQIPHDLFETRCRKTIDGTAKFLE